jgi:hypothetical protein
MSRLGLGGAGIGGDAHRLREQRLGQGLHLGAGLHFNEFPCAIYARPTWAGIFLGLATGCRITSLAMLVPIAVVVFALSGSNSMRGLIRFVALSIISAVCFSLRSGCGTAPVSLPSTKITPGLMDSLF